MANMIYHIVRNFLNKPSTRLYPEKQREPFERFRGKIFFENENCIYCGICERKCPADAIKVDRKNTSWELNAYRCIICGECSTSCPKKCIKLLNTRRHSAVEKKIIRIKKSGDSSVG